VSSHTGIITVSSLSSGGGCLLEESERRMNERFE